MRELDGVLLGDVADPVLWEEVGRNPTKYVEALRELGLVEPRHEQPAAEQLPTRLDEGPTRLPDEGGSEAYPDTVIPVP